MSFSNKVVLVTGGSSGIGASIAIAFAKEGADVAIVGRSEAKLNNVAEEIKKNGKEPLIIKADITKDEDLKSIVKKTIDRYQKLDILINNAGVLLVRGVTEENYIEIYDQVLSTNLRSAVLLTHLAAPHLISTKGNIVNISSVAGTSPLNGILSVGYSPYCTSKAGLDHFSRVAALELAAKDVRVNIISPGPVETPLVANSGELTDDAIANSIALKNMTQPEEIADMALYLASDKARSITGSNFTVDGGLLLKM